MHADHVSACQNYPLLSSGIVFRRYPQSTVPVRLVRQLFPKFRVRTRHSSATPDLPAPLCRSPSPSSAPRGRVGNAITSQRRQLLLATPVSGNRRPRWPRPHPGMAGAAVWGGDLNSCAAGLATGCPAASLSKIVAICGNSVRARRPPSEQSSRADR